MTSEFKFTKDNQYKVKIEKPTLKAFSELLPGNSVLGKLFFIELLLLFSFAASYAVLSLYGQHSPPFSNIRQYENLFENYRVLNDIIQLPDNLVTAPKKKLKTKAKSNTKSNTKTNTKTKINSNSGTNALINSKTDAKIDFNTGDEPGNQLVKATGFLKQINTLIAKKKYKQAGVLINRLELPHPFINKKKNRLYLKTLYFQQQFKPFLKRIAAHPVSGKGSLQLRLLQINCLIKTGDKQKAFALFKELFFQNKLRPFHNYLPASSLTLFLKQLTYEDWLKKFNLLAEKNRFTEFLGLKRYTKAPQLIALYTAEFYYRRKKYSSAISLLRRVKSATLLPHKEKILLKIRVRRRNYDDIFSKLEEVKGNPPIHAELLFDTASILLIHGKLDLSLQLLMEYIKTIENKKALPLDKHNSRYWKGIWLAAWINYRKEENKKAMRFFKKGALSDNDAYRSASIYWYSRLDNSTPTQLENFPYSYYYTKTGDAVDAPHGKSVKSFVALINGKQSPLFLRYIADFKALLENGLPEESFDFVGWAKEEDSLSDSEQNVFKVIESILYLKKKDFYHAFIKFRRNFGCYRCLRLPKFLSGIYTPIRYGELVESYCNRYNLDKSLVLSLIRQESFFRPYIVSPAKANGLMQLLYSTAKGVARGLGMRIKKYDLYNPKINISLGTRHLRTLLDRYNNKLHLVLAAYNAGEHRVDRWLRRFGHVPDDVFIEMIPFSETRTYVKTILRNYYYYKFYYGK
ncbi:MAG: lytic transglycosylase domain-containing protein [bacterium]|nr:lytic transglycosylase domain-containing protein [bacterium]